MPLDSANAAKAHRHLHYPPLALLKPEAKKKKKTSSFLQSSVFYEYLLSRSKLQDEIQCAINLGGKHF